MQRYFTGEQYRLRYSPELDGVDAFQHFNQYGRNEGRECAFPEGWTEEGYLAANKDIADDPVWSKQAALHWLIDGARHGRPYKKASPNTWQPPTQYGFVTPALPGPFFMAGMEFPDGLRIGTYKDGSGISRLYKYDGAFHELWQGPCESVYMIQRRKNGRVMFSTECPAAIGIEDEAGKITVTKLRGEVDSLAFDIWPFRGGWMVFTASNVLYGRIRVYTSQDDGATWQLYKEHTCQDGIFKQLCTDGQTYYLVGHKNRLPYIEREDGKQILLMKDYKDQEINYASVKDGLFTLGLNNIDALISDGTRRNGYVMYGTVDGMYHSGIDCAPPWIMQTEVYPSGRYAVASIWNEGGYPNPEIVGSKDGRTGWAKIASVPFHSVQTMDESSGGIYCFGGQYGQFGQVYVHKV